MNVAIGVCNDHVELLSVGEEVGSCDFDILRGFTKGSHLVGFLLQSALSLATDSATNSSKSKGGLAYVISG